MGIFESEEAFLANEAFRERGELRIRGSGGGGGKSSGSGTDDENTLRSKARARMIEAISEGEIEGLVNGERSIFFDQTPVKNADGTYNFKNVVWREHKGLPDEGHFSGHSGVETPNSVEVQVKASVGPVQRTIVDQNADAVRVILRIPALFYQDKKKGETKTTSLAYRIEVRAYQGGWTTAVEKNIDNEKCTSPYQIAHRIELPLDGSPWDIRVVRLTPDSDKVELQNDLWWEGYVTIVDGKFTYPFTAAVGLEVNGEDMGQSIPARSFHVKGIKVLVPSNYNPVTRQYSGIWNGTFKRAWTNNPAWIFFDLITNDRYGLGEFISSSIVDKWSLYTIAQYCDQLVPSGYRNGDTGEMIMEPRFTYNGVINNREEAYHVLQAVTAAWRGMAYWSLGQVFATADIPADPVKIVTPANVLGGEFHYSGTALKARHSVCIIKWNDPDDFYRPATEIVINDAMLRRYGWREKSVTFDGCTSRGLAHRYGKWILDVEQNENETVEYNASWDHAEVRPGDIVAISDPAKAQVRAGGRVVAYDSSTRTVTLDGPFEATPGEAYSLMVAMPNGKLETRNIVSWPAINKAVISTVFSQALQPDAMYAITGTDITPRQFRVLSVREEEKNVFKVTALFHDPNKYARVEQNIKFDPLPYTRPKNVAYPPEALTVREVHYQIGGQQQSRMLFSWTPNPNFLSKSFRVRVLTPFDGELNVGETDKTWTEINNTVAGKYRFMVCAVSLTGMQSDWVELEYDATGPEGIPLPTISNIRLNDRVGNEFLGRDVNILWNNNFSNSSDPTSEEGAPSTLPSPFYRNNTVKVYETASNTLLREQSVTGTNFVYTFDMNFADSRAKGFDYPRRSLRFEVTVTDTFGRTSTPASQVFQNTPPAAIVPSHLVNGDTIYLSFDQPTNADFAGFLIWYSTTSGYNPMIEAPNADTADTHVVIPADQRQTYYFRFAAYDAFGKDGLNYSPEIEIVTSANGVDTEPPAIPVNLILASILDGTGARLTAVWDENTELDLAGYDVEIKEGDGNWVSFVTSTNRYEWNAKSGLTYSIRLRAFDGMGNSSPYTSEQTHTVIVDTVPPSVPTNVHASAGVDAIWLNWTNPADADLAHIEILEGVTNDEAAATIIAVVNGSSFARVGLTFKTERFYWLRAVDLSGNKSALSDMASATTGDVPQPLGVAITGIVFTPHDDTDKISWTAGEITTGQPGQAPTTYVISAGEAQWTAGSVYLYWSRSASDQIKATANITTIFADSGILVGVYHGGYDFALAGGKAMVDGASIIAQTIGANALVANSAVITGSAQIADAVITSAKIVELTADKIKAGTTLSNTIIIGGTTDTIADVRNRSMDPAGAINAGVTLIDPGKIVIAGATTLADWRTGGDLTKINGGAISANTIDANKLSIGLRGIKLTGITFDYNSPTNNRVSWTTGSIDYTGDDGAPATVTITAGQSMVWTTGTVYIYWTKGSTTLNSTATLATAFNANNVVLATYRGNANLNADYGRTVIDGALLKTGTVIADQVAADIIEANNIKSSAIETRHIKSSAITADHIAADEIETRHLKSQIITAKQMVLYDAQNWVANGDFEDLDAEATWVFSGSNISPQFGGLNTDSMFYLSTTASQTGRYALALDRKNASYGTNLNAIMQNKFQVTGGSTLTVSAAYGSLSGASDSGFFITLYWYDRAGAQISIAYLWNNTSIPSAISEQTRKIVAPASAAYCRLRVTHGSSSSVPTLFVDRVAVRMTNAASLIVDGGISAVHLDVDSIETRHLTINSVSIDKIVQGASNGTSASSGTTTCTSTLNVLRGGCLIICNATFSGLDAAVGQGPIAIYKDNALFRTANLPINGAGSCAFAVFDTPSAGTHSYRLELLSNGLFCGLYVINFRS